MFRVIDTNLSKTSSSPMVNRGGGDAPRKYARLFAAPLTSSGSLPVSIYESSSLITPGGPPPEYIIQTNANFSATGYDYGIYCLENGTFDITVQTTVEFLSDNRLEFHITRNGVDIPGTTFVTHTSGTPSTESIVISMKAFNITIAEYDMIQVSVKGRNGSGTINFRSNVIEIESV